MDPAILGILLTLLSSVCSGTGWVFQKRSHNKEEEDREKHYKKCSWYLGAVCIAAAQILLIIAALKAKQTTIGSVKPTGIIIHMLFGWMFLSEEISRRKIIGVCLLVPGTVLALYFASLESHRMNREEFDNWFYHHDLPIVYFSVNVGVLILGLLLCFFILRVHPQTDYQEFDDESNKSQKAPMVLDNNMVHSNRHRSERQPTCCKTLNVLFSSKRWRMFPCVFIPYYAAFIFETGFSFVRVVYWFFRTPPPQGMSSNFEGVEPKLYFVLIAV